MKQLKDIEMTPEWQTLVYSEAWKQYCHEDNIGVSRMQVFLAVESAFIAVLALISKPLMDLDSVQLGCHSLHLGLAVLAGFMVIIGILLFFLAWVWRCVTTAGRCYLNLRWFPIYAMEKLAQLDDVNLAGVENGWRKFFKSKENRCKKYPIHQDIQELEEEKFELGPLPRFRGWTSFESITWVFQVISVLLAIAGIALIFLTRALWLESNL